MAAISRPYICTFNGVTRMVDAKDPGAVVRHVVGAAVSELRPARAGEVAAWAREKKEIEIPGHPTKSGAAEATIENLAVSGTIAVADDFNAEDALEWLHEAMGMEIGSLYNREQERAASAWHNAESSGQLNLMQFDELRQSAPKFAEAIAATLVADSTAIDSVRAAIEDRPVQFEVVVSAIAAQKRVELYDEPAGASEKMVGDTGHLDT